MENKIKNIIITMGFILLLLLILISNILKEEEEISISERRKLAQFPEITIKKLINGDVTKELEKSAVDQFILRDTFRKIKSFFSINVLRQLDNNNLFEKDNYIYKIDYPLNEKNVINSFNKINDIYNKYLSGMNVYYAIIPDKNYYLENDKHLRIDYNHLKEIAFDKLLNIKYIDIWDDLELSDYYRTDPHWKQENLLNVVKKLQTAMNLENTQSLSFTKTDMGNFYGAYYGQLGLNIEPDNMYILTNEILDSCKVYNYESKETTGIYNNNKTNDKYDIYLSGATPLITIENPNSTTNKELLLFRDSFGSSLAPLLIQDYNKITLIDIRYISSSLLDNYIEFNNQDVLFLYSTLILNQNIFK